MAEKQFYDFIIIIDLKQREVCIPEVVNCSDHADPGIYLVPENRIGGAMGFPFLPLEIRIIKPALIDVDDPLALLQQLYELHGEHLPQYQTLIRVGVVRYPLDSFIF